VCHSPLNCNQVVIHLMQQRRRSGFRAAPVVVVAVMVGWLTLHGPTAGAQSFTEHFDALIGELETRAAALADGVGKAEKKQLKAVSGARKALTGKPSTSLARDLRNFGKALKAILKGERSSLQCMPSDGDGGGVTVLHSFPHNIQPEAGLAKGPDANFYGSTKLGGNCVLCGTLFRVTPEGQHTPLHSFFDLTARSAAGPLLPRAGVTQSMDGRLYGASLGGGAGNFGTAFRVPLP
jgi:uncharacterized repeat protein (TIGR03803 family)